MTSKIEEVARAIYDAIDPNSGDHIATVIHMSDHLFWDDRMPGATDSDRQLYAVMEVCRAAARAAIKAMREPTNTMLKAACASMSPGKRPVAVYVPVKQKHIIRYNAMIDAALGNQVSAQVSVATPTLNVSPAFTDLQTTPAVEHPNLLLRNHSNIAT